MTDEDARLRVCLDCGGPIVTEAGPPLSNQLRRCRYCGQAKNRAYARRFRERVARANGLDVQAPLPEPEPELEPLPETEPAPEPEQPAAPPGWPPVRFA